MTNEWLKRPMQEIAPVHMALDLQLVICLRPSEVPTQTKEFITRGQLRLQKQETPKAHNLTDMALDLSVRASGLNTGRVYSELDKIRVGCISCSGKIQVEYISVLRVSDQPNGFRAPFF